MKLTIILILFGMLNASATLHSQTIVNLQFENVTLRDALEKIEKATSFKFLYRPDQINVNKKVNLDARNLKIEDVLIQLLDQSIRYQIMQNNLIVLTANTGIKISGRVTSKNGDGLPGVNVLLKGSGTGTITDLDGKYTLEVPDQKAILVFSFIGFIPFQVEVGNKTTIDVELLEDFKNLDEVVVVGYGSQRKSDVTGSLVSVKSDAMNAIPTSNVAEMLRGQAAGIQVTQTSSRPGGTSDIFIRGKRSLTASNQPLFIVDGVPVTNIDDFNAQDIKSLEVLKDASSQAIYGARASNGVILITTYRGEEGKIHVELNSYLATQQLKRNFDFYSGEEWAQLRREAYRSTKADGQYDADKDVFTPSMLDALNNKQFTNWEDICLSPAILNNHTLSVRAGNDKTKFASSIGYYDQKGMVAHSGFQRANIRFNVDQKLTKKVNVGFNFNYTYTKKNNEEGQLNEFIMMNPLSKAYDDQGNMISVTGDQQWNPMWNNDNAVDETKNYRLLMNVFLDWEILKGLKYKLNTSLNTRDYENGTYLTRLHENGKNDYGRASITNFHGYEYLIENILTYDKKINAHKFDLTVVQSLNKQLDTETLLAGNGFSSDLLTYNAIASAAKILPTKRKITPRNLVSYMGRARYSLMDRYLFSASVRWDGSSVFGVNNKYGFFPAASFAWRMTEESFLKDINYLSNLKFRLSYGSVGSQGVDPYQSQGVVNSYFMQFGTNNALVGYLPGTALWNPDLKWETSTSTNLGLDFGFLKDRISGTFEYYNTKTTDLLLDKSLNQTTGYSQQLVNIGETNNKGIEISLSLVPIQKPNFSWTLDFSYSANRSKIVALNGAVDATGKPVDDVANLWFIGHPMDVYFDYKFDGIWQTADTAIIKASAMPNAKPGDVRIADANADGKIDPNDRTIIDRSPKWIGSVASTMKYKGIDFSLDFYTVQGTIRKNSYLYDFNSGGSLAGKLNGLKVDYWTPENPSNTAPRPHLNKAPIYMEALSYQNSSYVRLRNIMLGYTLPKQILSKLHIKTLRIYGSATNLLTFTDYLSYSPEVSPGSYPEPRTFTVGLNVSF